MFDRIRKALSRDAKEPGESVAPNSQLAHGPVSEWAATRGFGFSVDGTGQTVSLEGTVEGKPWRIQMGGPSRQYIRGEEVRARAELGIDDDVSILLINRPLKDALEKQAYEMYTDTLQTSADPRLPEEMRWLAMFDEVGWDSLPQPFWDRYALLTDNREHALAWMDPEFARLAMEWPEPGPSAEVPFMMLLLRGKAYLRMEYSPAATPTLEHASRIFIAACEGALGSFPLKPSK
jgi:hypothetical protein